MSDAFCLVFFFSPLPSPSQPSCQEERVVLIRMRQGNNRANI